MQTVEYLRANRIDVLPPTTLPDDIASVAATYPGATEFFETTFPALSLSLRGEGFTRSTELETENGLSYRRFYENTYEHTVGVFARINRLFADNPVLERAFNRRRTLATTLVHDIQEIAGGDVPQSRPDRFYFDPRYVSFLQLRERQDLLEFIFIDQDGTIRGDEEVITNGHFHFYEDEYVLYEEWVRNHQKAFGFQLLGTISDPETAVTFQECNDHFENKEQHLDDGDVWLARYGDIWHEAEGLCNNRSAEVETYADGEDMTQELVEEVKRKTIGLTTGRLLEPALNLIRYLDGDEEAQLIIYLNTLGILRNMAVAGYPENIESVVEAIDYFKETALFLRNGEMSIQKVLAEIQERWIEPGKKS